MKHSTIVSYIALFIALSGTAFAAVSLPRNSVGSAQIKNSSVARADLRPSARPPLASSLVTRSILRDAVTDIVTDPATGITIKVTGEQGPQGVPGPQGVAGPQGEQGVAAPVVQINASRVLAPQEVATLGVACPAGTKVTGGGASVLGEAVVQTSAPAGDNAWSARVSNRDTDSRTLTVTAICQ